MFTKIISFLKKNLWFTPLALGAILRLIDLTKSSIWHDEGYTMWLLRYDFAEILTRTARDVHPPMYYLISKVWVSVFGTSVFSIRFMSLLFSLGIIFLVYKIIENLFSQKAAFWSAILVAFSPFMIRFAQEARMYGVVAFFTTLATYYFIKFVKENKNKYLVGYVLAMIVAMYTQYYSFFVIISLWAIYAIITWKKKGLLNWKWWAANLSLLVLYLPWFPVAYRQVTRVSGSYWIQPEWITIRTVPNNVLQFFTYSHMDSLYNWSDILAHPAYWLLALALIATGVVLFKSKENRAAVLSLYIFGFLPMLLVYAVSELKTPIYQDRYFPFSAVGIFAIWGCVIAIIKSEKAKYTVATVLLVTMTMGIVYMHTDVNHQMKQLVEDVRSQAESSDEIYSGSLYTFLDSSYYMDYADIKFISEAVDGYGESSLFYDQANEYLALPGSVGTSSDRVWVIGRVGEDYANNSALAEWTKETVINKGTIEAVLYTK